ncbi:hypothetical protein [Epibacterium ulvae]|uniref:hypothetical protein n=1 Tax=Epibacterium ulvae TaxID=1156985 RepID=UPI002491E473|nr:hypothetical protein [Epibacterium ulvae]
MAKYLYSGVRQGVSLATGTEKIEGVEQATFEDFDLIPGPELDLPENNEAVKNMVEAGLLTPVGGSKTAAKRKATGGEADA